MSNIYDNDILMTKSNDLVYIDLECGFGQPSVTTIHLKKKNGTTEELKTFNNNVKKEAVGKISDLKFNALDIHTTIHDVRDNATEKEDISLIIKVYDIESNFVETAFTRKTKGKGAVFHSFYLVTII